MYNDLPENCKVTHCEECGICEKHCPYELKIVEKLKNAHNILTDNKSFFAV